MSERPTLYTEICPSNTTSGYEFTIGLQCNRLHGRVFLEVILFKWTRHVNYRVHKIPPMAPSHPVHILKTRFNNLLPLQLQNLLHCTFLRQPMQFATSSQMLHFLHCAVRLVRRPDSESEGKFVCAGNICNFH